MALPDEVTPAAGRRPAPRSAAACVPGLEGLSIEAQIIALATDRAFAEQVVATRRQVAGRG